mmetsp:Transcript_16742/g.44929  ORF Transcript_16742/g.44929 Transcript_16742/m.44929 type:complete len:185 (-) Transcript_16742:877-1431(-)
MDEFDDRATIFGPTGAEDGWRAMAEQPGAEAAALRESLWESFCRRLIRFVVDEYQDAPRVTPTAADEFLREQQGRMTKRRKAPSDSYPDALYKLFVMLSSCLEKNWWRFARGAGDDGPAVDEGGRGEGGSDSDSGEEDEDGEGFSAIPPSSQYGRKRLLAPFPGQSKAKKAAGATKNTPAIQQS